MASKILLYDLPTKGPEPRTWSPNPLKTRLLLAYKGLPYETQWVEFPDVKSTISALPLKPNKPGTAAFDYSVPTVRLPGATPADPPTYVMESLEIAKAIDARYPDPPLRVTDGNEAAARAQAACGETFRALQPIWVGRVPKYIINERAVDYFHRSRCAMFKVDSLEQLAADPARTGENAWKAANEGGLKKLAALLRENEGPYVLGDEVAYADLVILALWEGLKTFDEAAGENDLFERAVGSFDGVFKRHYDRTKHFMEKIQTT